MAIKNPPCDITLELSAHSRLSDLQLDLYKDILEVYKRPKYRETETTSLRVYFLGYEKPSNIPGTKSNNHRRKK